MSGKREARAEKTKKGRCQQFYSTVCIMDNRHRGFKCGEEMRDSVQERKFGHRLMRGWGCHLIVFTHLALVVECLDPRGLLCCKNLLGQVKGQREGLIAAIRAQFHVLIVSNGA